jgi:hypothetical protein
MKIADRTAAKPMQQRADGCGPGMAGLGELHVLAETL